MMALGDQDSILFPDQLAIERSKVSMRSRQQNQTMRETFRDHVTPLLPTMSYRGALSCCFTLDQKTYTVGNCPDTIFKRFISACGQAGLNSKNWKPVQQDRLLHMLELDCSDVVRWYSINLLLEHKISVPLESSE